MLIAVLDEEEDALINVNIVDKEKVRWNSYWRILILTANFDESMESAFICFQSKFLCCVNENSPYLSLGDLSQNKCSIYLLK